MTFATQRATAGSSSDQRDRVSAGGFSLIELTIVLAIILIAGGIFFVNMVPALKEVRASSSLNTVLATVRRARESAVSQRRVYVVNFIAPNTVQVTQNNDTGPLMTSITLNPDVTFVAMTGLPTPAPDSFGGGLVAVDFDQNVAGGNKNEIFFQPDGSATDINNNVNNGVLYLALNNDLNSTRALSVWGATGRVRAWRIGWKSTGVAYWRQQ